MQRSKGPVGSKVLSVSGKVNTNQKSDAVIEGTRISLISPHILGVALFFG